MLLDQLPAETLMEPFGVVVGHEFIHHVAQVSFPEEDELVQTLGFDGKHAFPSSMSPEFMRESPRSFSGPCGGNAVGDPSIYLGP
jgi:hypothetical protein